MTSSSSSVIVVEIDTRKGPFRSLFDSSVVAQSEQARQFWKALTLPPHIESRLYSKEINQQLKLNRLKPIKIDNSRKLPQSDEKTETFFKNLETLNHVDDIMKLQKRFEKFQLIKESHRINRDKFKQVANAHRSFVQNQNLIKNVPQIDLNFDEQEQVDQDSLSGNEDEENLVKNLE